MSRRAASGRIGYAETTPVSRHAASGRTVGAGTIGTGPGHPVPIGAPWRRCPRKVHRPGTAPGSGRRWAGLAPGRRVTDRGGATVCLLAVGLVYVVVGLFGAALGAARVARQQARAAADFGALAGAGRALDGDAVACRRAGEFTGANGARLVACRLDGLDVLVTAEVTVSPMPWLTRTATATARAGPVRG